MKHTITIPPKVSRQLSIEEGFMWNGSLFQIDPTSQIFIAAKALSIIKAQLNNEVYENILWRTYDNQFYSFTAEEFLAFSVAVETHIENILKTSWNVIDNKA